jgi:hypothetical protein
LRQDDQLLNGPEQEFSSSRPHSTISPKTATNQLRANAVECKNMKKQISYLKKKMEANKKTMKIPASDSSICELVVNILGIILDEKWNAKERIIDALLEVEGNSKLGAGNVYKCKKFTEHILGEIKNRSKRMSGKKKNHRCLPKVIHVWLWLYGSKITKPMKSFKRPNILYCQPFHI